MQNTTKDNKFLDYVNNDNTIFNTYRELLDVYYDMLKEFEGLMTEWMEVVKKSPDELRLSGLSARDENDSHMLLVWLGIHVVGNFKEGNEISLTYNIKEAFNADSYDKFHAILRGRAVYKTIKEEIEKRSR